VAGQAEGTEQGEVRSVALLLTDVEASTRLWEQDPRAMAAALERHDRIAADTVAAAGGRVEKPRGEGDSVFAVFEDPAAAVAGALALQRALLREPWPQPADIRVRMGVHCGIAERRDGQYYGTEPNRCARLRGLARGGEILLSDLVARAVRTRLPEGASLLDLGSHRLKDVARPERIHRLLHPDLPADFPPISAPSSHPNNLPLQVTSFVGRDREARELAELVRAQSMVTLHGPGGVGKTRLAVETADDLLEDFPDGIWFVDLAPMGEAAALPVAVASAMGIRDQPGRSLVETVADQLRDARALLLLDNCEHLVAAAAQLAGDLLRACAQLRILATSRETLGVYGECVFGLAPLGVPVEVGSIAAVVEVAAARLLVDRVRAVRGSFEPVDADAPVIAAVCRRLDGIPLAMELAAARASSLSLAQIEQRLDDRFRLLRGGPRAHPPRQQTLEAMVDWSYSLLEPQQQVVLRRLSVFAGPFDLAAAEQVAGAPPLHAADVLDVLDRLVRRSLLVSVPEDALPYRLLDTIRAYGHGELLEAGDFEATAARHQAFHLAAAEQNQFADAAGVARTRAMMDNLRAALQRCIDAGDEDTALRMCSALLGAWTGDGHLHEARMWLSRALAMSDRADPLRVRALCSAAALALSLRQQETAAREAAQALALSERCGDSATLARAHHAVARCAFFGGDDETARQHVTANLEQARLAGNRYLESDALTLHGLLAGRTGDWAAAVALQVEARDIVRGLGDALGDVAASFHVGLAQECAGDTRSALASYRETAQLAAAASYHEFLYCARCALARHAAGNGGLADAAAHLRGALAALRAVDGLNPHRVLESGAALALARGESETALRLVAAAAQSDEDATEGPAGVCAALRQRGIAALSPQMAETLSAGGAALSSPDALELVRSLAG
jgi:predicted ATPase/class 3 adenylate cyclase